MATPTPTFIITALALTTATAFAGDHGQIFSSCGTDAQPVQRPLVGAGIYPVDSLEYHLTPDLIEALNQPQKDLLLAFEAAVLEGEMAPHVCLHPDSDPKVAQAFEQFLNDLWFQSTPNAFILNNRWTSTATNGGGLTQGTPTTLTYSFVPDNTLIVGEGRSDLFEFMDSRIGSGTWQDLFHTALNAWSNVSGLNYVFEPNDDGINISGSGGGAGQLGVRGDVRIAGNFVDGNSNVLAYNFFPNNGDMVIDTGDVAFFPNASNNYIRLRNVVTHEAGHGIGLAHVESDSNRFLMEPFIDISFTGPQLDDIRGAHRGYGDPFEFNNGFFFPTEIADSSPATPGFNGGDFAFVEFHSMDDNSDVDYFSLETNEPVTLIVQLTPTGGSYQVTGQGGGGGGSFFNANAVSDLRFTIFNSNFGTEIAVDDTGAGQNEFTSIELPEPGQYFIVVDNDNANSVQLYSMTVSTSTLDIPNDCAADLTDDGSLNFFDVSAFLDAFGNQDDVADFNDDGSFNFFDVSAFLDAFAQGCP